MPGKQGGTVKPLKAPKKEARDLDEVKLNFSFSSAHLIN